MKHNFARIFDRPVFRALFNAIVTFANGRPKMKKYGTHETETKTQTNGCLDPKNLENDNITLYLPPEDYM